VHAEPLGTTGLGEKAPEWARDHAYVRREVDKCVALIPEILNVTEIQGACNFLLNNIYIIHY